MKTLEEYRKTCPFFSDYCACLADCSRCFDLDIKEIAVMYDKLRVLCADFGSDVVVTIMDPDLHRKVCRYLKNI